MNDYNQSPDDQRTSDSTSITHWFNPSTHLASEGVIFAVAHATDVEPTESPRFMDGFDSDALDALIREGWSSPKFSIQASVVYAEYTAAVDTGGLVEVVSHD